MIKETIENVGNANKNKDALEKEKRKNKIPVGGRFYESRGDHSRI